MKVLIAHPDSLPGGFNFTESHELLQFPMTVCRRAGCGCDRSWTGSRTKNGATLARVVEPPGCFRPKPELMTIYLQRAFDVAAGFSVGTLVRVRFDWDAGVEPGACDVERYLDACIVTIAGPN